MPDATSPSGTASDTTLTFDQGVEDISNLLTDPETDHQDEDQVQETTAETDGEELEVEADAQEDDTVDAEEPEGSDEVKGGRFAPDTAKVTLDDGTVTTIAELKRNNLFQRDYTRKTTELKAERETFEQQKDFVGRHAQAVATQRNFLLSVASKFLPQAPDRSMMDADPIGYMQAKAEYDDRMAVVNQLVNAQEGERYQAENERQEKANQTKRIEAEKMLSAIPEFKNPKVYHQFWSEAVPMMVERYGFSEQEVDANMDHRFYVMMRDLLRLQKAQKSAPAVKEQIQGKPKLISGGKRMDPKAKTSREVQARSQRLRQSGTLEAGVAALMDLDL